jgi:hypothetical protein
MTITATSSAHPACPNTASEHARVVSIAPYPRLSPPVLGASAHIARLRDRNARAQLVLAPDAEVPLIEPSTPDIHAYLESAEVKMQLTEILDKQDMKERIRQEVIKLGCIPDGKSITQLLWLCDEQARAELPPALKTQKLENESVLLRSSRIPQSLVQNVGARKSKVCTALRGAATAYVAARHLLSEEEFQVVWRRVRHRAASIFLEKILSEHGSDGLQFIRDFENYLIDAPGEKFNPHTIQVYRAQCARLMQAGATLFVNSTAYPKEQRAYGWSHNMADTHSVIQHVVEEARLKKSKKTGPPLTPAAQRQTDHTESCLQSQLLTVAKYMDKVAQSRPPKFITGPLPRWTCPRGGPDDADAATGGLANPIAAEQAAAPSPTLSAAHPPTQITTRPNPSASNGVDTEGVTGALNDPVSTPGLPRKEPGGLHEPVHILIADAQVTQDSHLQDLLWDLPLTFPDLDPSFFDEPVASQKRNAGQAFSDSP